MTRGFKNTPAWNSYFLALSKIFPKQMRFSCTFPSTSALQAVDDGVKRIRSEADSIPAAPSPALPSSASARSIVNHVKLSTCLIDSVFEGVLVLSLTHFARHLISTSGEWFCILLARAYGCYALCLKMRKHPAGRWLPRERLSLFWRKHVVGATRAAQFVSESQCFFVSIYCVSQAKVRFKMPNNYFSVMIWRCFAKKKS